MNGDIVFTAIWLTGSVAGYFLARIVWKKIVVTEIRDDDNIFLTLLSLMLSWCMVVGSLAYLIFYYLYTAFADIDDEAYFFGKKGEELTDNKKEEK